MKKIIVTVSGIIIFAVGIYWIIQTVNSRKIFDTPVKIGIMMPFSGDAGNIGYGVLKGIQLAVKDIGVTNIELIQEDTKCDKALVPAGFENLVQKGVIAVIGEGCSGASLAALPLADKAKVVLLSPASSSPDLSIANDYFFRVVPPDTLQGKIAATYVYGKGKRKAALLYTNEPYGRGLTKSFKENFIRLGGTVVADVSFMRDVINLQKEAASVQSSGPDVVYLVSNSLTSASAVIRLMRSQGVGAMIFGSEALGDNIIIKDAGASAEGVMLTSFSGGTVAFRRSMKSAYGTSEGFYGAAQGYDAYKALFLAVSKGARTGEAVKIALSALAFDGVSGKIKFDSFGDVSEGYVYDIYQITNGKFVRSAQ
jgi:branched-chain amino acid transport system substrate-binding protein